MPIRGDEAAFLEAIRDAPEDLAPRLIFADWLDEHDRHEEAVAYRLPIPPRPLPVARRLPPPIPAYPQSPGQTLPVGIPVDELCLYTGTCPQTLSFCPQTGPADAGGLTQST